jgi:hypothetical protein
MAAGHRAELFRLLDTREPHEPGQVVPVGPPGLVARQVAKPLGFGRHVGQAGKFRGGEGAGRCRAKRLEVASHGRQFNHG